MLQGFWYNLQVDCVDNFITKMNCLHLVSQFTGHTIRLPFCTNKIILHTRHYFKELATVKVAMELIMMVKRTQICTTRNEPLNRDDEPVALSTKLNFTDLYDTE